MAAATGQARLSRQSGVAEPAGDPACDALVARALDCANHHDFRGAAHALAAAIRLAPTRAQLWHLFGLVLQRLGRRHWAAWAQSHTRTQHTSALAVLRRMVGDTPSARNLRRPLLCLVPEGTADDTSVIRSGEDLLEGCTRMLGPLAEHFWGRLHFVTPRELLQWAGAMPADVTVFSLLADADLLRRDLELACRIERLHAFRWINRPSCQIVNTRERAAERLASISSLRVPGTWRVAASRSSEIARLAAILGFPLVLRPTGAHNGAGLTLVRDAATLDAVSAGMAGRDVYVAEYLDCRSPEGLCTKHRLVCIGAVWFPEHVFIAEDWIVNSASDQTRHSEVLRGVSVRQMRMARQLCKRSASLASIAARVKLDCFMIDAHIGCSGQITLFECNAVFALPPLPEIQRGEPHLLGYHQAIHQSLKALLQGRALGRAEVLGHRAAWLREAS